MILNYYSACELSPYSHAYRIAGRPLPFVSMGVTRTHVAEVLDYHCEW